MSQSTAEAYAASLPDSSTFVLISGNMDDGDLQSSGRVVYLRDNLATIAGLKVYGSPWTPKFVGSFQLHSASQARSVWDKLKAVRDDVDVLVTHGPPKGILDVTSRGRGVGDAFLRDVVLDDGVNNTDDSSRSALRLHCFGHIHNSYGTETKNGILFVNAAVFDHGTKPIVVDVPLDRKLPPVIVPYS